jgi:hypothetical protein
MARAGAQAAAEDAAGIKERLLSGAGSTGRRNTGVKFLCRGFKSQGLAWPLIDARRQFTLAAFRSNGNLGNPVQ